MSSSTTVYCNTHGRLSIIVGIIIDLVGCAAPPTPFGVAILVWTRSPRRPALFDFCSHLTRAVSPNHRLARSTVHYQMAWEHLRSSRCPYGAMSEPISPFCRGPIFRSQTCTEISRRSITVSGNCGLVWGLSWLSRTFHSVSRFFSW